MNQKLLIGGGLALLIWAMTKRASASTGSPGTQPQPLPEPEPDDEPYPDWGDEEIDGPAVGDYWRWPDTIDGAIPLIHRPGDRRLMGVYRPNGDHRLIAVVDSEVRIGTGYQEQYLVIATWDIPGFPPFFPK